MRPRSPLAAPRTPKPAAVQPAQPATQQPATSDDFLQRYAATYRFSLGRPAAISLTPDGGQVLFLRSGPRDFVRNLYEVDTATGTEKLLLSAEQLLGGRAEELTAEELARRERLRLAARGIAAYDLSKDGQQLLVPLSGKLYLVGRASGQVRVLNTGDAAPLDPQLSPDSKQLAWVADGDLNAMRIDGDQPVRLTTGATETLTRGLAEFVAQEEMDRMHGFWWSPDSSQIVYQETDTAGVELLYIADPAHPERPPQPWRYPRAGKTNATVRLGIVSASGGETRWIEWDREAFPYLTNVVWDKGAPLVIVVQNRAQSIVEVLEVDPATGRTSPLLRETDEAWVNLDSSVPRWLPNGQGFVWSTDRRGAAQLELRARDGAIVRPLHAEQIVYRGLLAIDAAGEFAYIAGSEVPTETHIYRLSLAADKPAEKISKLPGVHAATFSEQGNAWVGVVHEPDGSVRQTVHRQGDEQQTQLTSVAEAANTPLHIEWTNVTDDQIRALIVRPSDFQPGRRYPVIVHVYGGPHSQMVTTAGSRYFLDQWMANQGYIVVSLDGRGTPGRTRAWERAIRGNLIQLPLDDQIRGLRALGENYPELDLTRVGIFGWSFGGYFSALATCRRPDVLRVGVAGAPVTDWSDYDTHYTERYLGLPDENAEGYRASSALTTAKDLQRPLLLIHGTADDNVYFLHSLKLADALFRADRACEFVPLVGMTHMVTEPTAHQMLYEQIMQCFNRELRPKEYSAERR